MVGCSRSVNLNGVAFRRLGFLTVEVKSWLVDGQALLSLDMLKLHF